MAKTVNGVTTRHLVDDLNPTGYAQVVEESVNGSVQRAYAYGRQRIDVIQLVNNTWTLSFYGYDGFGSVRQLTNATGAATDSYDYDAFGNKINSTGSTPNNYLYRGEQYDSDLGLYYLRARYYNPLTGRFMSRDPQEECGCSSIPDAAKNKYIYADSDPVNRLDPSGRSTAVEDEEIESEVDLGSVGRKTVPKGAFWGGIGLTGFGLEIACMYYTEGAGVGVVGQNIGGLQDPKLLPRICSAISSKMPYIPRPGAVPWPFDPDDVRTDPNSGWGCNAALTECTKRCPNGNTSYLHYDPGTKYGEGPHWDYKDCDGKTWKIWPDGTMTPANG